MSFAPIAVVGRACVLPGALTPSRLWEAVAAGRDLLSPIPEGRWRLAREHAMCAPDAPSADRTWSDRGGHVQGFEQVWDPGGFAIEAAELGGLDPLVHWTLHSAREALRDVRHRPARCGAIFGNLGFPSERMAAFAESVWFGEQQARSEAGFTPAERREGLEGKRRSVPLLRVDPRNRFMAGGTAELLRRALDLGGDSFCLDAACASSLYAIKLACDALHDGRADVMLAGAVQGADDLFLHVGFCALSALSRSGRSRPFHRAADGLVPAEGAAFVALKRLDDARRDGDTIHGVIRGVGLSNDGRGKGLLAPAEEGQQRALRAAYDQAGFGPERVSLLECHATGTPVGDATELRSTAAVYAGLRDVPLGSLKSNLGHLITVAGVAGLIKVLEAMRAGQRPPTLHVDEPTRALEGTPFRLLTKAEAWTCDGPRVAAVSAFGFGGNNAHLLVSEDSPELHGALDPTPGRAVAVVGMGSVVASAPDRAALTDALLSGASLLTEGEGRMAPLELDVQGLRFPPRDLQQSLAQQIATLQASREALAEVDSLPRESTGVFVGMEPDPEVARYGARWRLAGRGPAGWLERARDAVVPVLEAPAVVGTMPNIPANRLSSQFDLAGPAFTVQAGEASGLVALELAARALRSGELDAALVGAADLCCEPVQRAAAAALLPADRQVSGDAAVVLVLKRLSDAERDGDRIYARLEESSAAHPVADLTPRLGHAHAAAGLVQAAAAALALHHRATLDGRPWLPAGPRALAVRADRHQVHLAEAPGHPRRPERELPRLRCFAAADRGSVADALRANREGLEGRAWLVLVADDASFEQVRLRALAHLEKGAPAGAGVHFRERPIEGQLAFAFAGAGAAYRGMGRELLTHLPSLADALLARSRRLPQALAWSFEASDAEPTVLEQLWGASALCQLHVELTRGVLGLRPDAWLGYSSGETNALLASGTWTDTDQLIEESETCGLFTRELGGAFAAVQRRWGSPVRWASWTVLAPIAEVQAALSPRVRLAIVHTDQDCVIAGDAAECEAVVDRLGRQRCLRLGYPLAVHVPELSEVREEWLGLHRRATAPGARLYSNARRGLYEPSAEACAHAILDQADRTLDLRPTILQAWNDGVRVFVEHGPQAAFGRWIRDILGEREALVVSLDRKGRGLEATLDAVAALLAAGVPVRHQALAALLAPARRLVRGGPKLSFPGHPPAIVLPPVPRAEERPMNAETMAQAPALPAILNENWNRPAAAPVALPPPAPSVAARAAPVPAPGAPAVPPAVRPPAAAAPLAMPLLPAPPAVGSSEMLTRYQEHVAQLSQGLQDFVLAQQALHQRFLSMRKAAYDSLLHAASVAGSALPTALLEPPPQAAPAPRPVPAPVAPAVEAPPPAEPRPRPAAPAAPLAPKAAAPIAKAAAKAQVATGKPAPTGPTFTRQQLEIHAGGRISEIFGPKFAAQDGYRRQVRMPEPPLLLADRVVGLQAEPATMGKGTIWTETDVRWDSWYLHDAYMPPGVMIEAGQADLMLISYLGVDLLNRGERVYRLLGCELTYHGDLPMAGETLRYDIHLDGHAAQGDVRLMFFHYDCVNGDRPQLSVRKGQAGFFTDAELLASAGCLWSPEDQEIVPQPRLDPPAVATQCASFDRGQLEAFAAGDTFACFGPGFERAKTHTRSPRIPGGRMLLQDRITHLEQQGGPWGRGYLRAELDIQPDRWFFAGHFKNDPCMPGTLMFDGCLQALAFFLASRGYTIDRDAWRFQPVPEIAYQLQCRGQVIPTSQRLVTEVFVEEVIAGPKPTVYADLLCTVDGLKAFHARRVALELVPDWPLQAMPELVAEAASDPRPVAVVDGFRFDHASLLACAWGKPSHAFGPMYRRFDGPTRVARLPGPPYHFMSRINEVQGPIGVMKPGAKVSVDYDIPDDVWYFAENGNRSMPFAVLLEAALQPCGWLSSYVGSALTVDQELGFRNLDGNGTLHDELLPDSGTLTTHVELLEVSATGSMIIETFQVRCLLGEKPIYDLRTVFGFFPPAALAGQVGLPTKDHHRELLNRPSDYLVDLEARPLPHFAPERAQLAQPMLLMIDRVDGFWPGAGEAGLGQLRAVKDVDPGEWFFKAHFFQDPVQPGSLGIEAMIQALQFYMLETGMDSGIPNPRFECLATRREMSWKYRGQVLPHHRKVHTTLEVTEVGRDERGAFAICTASLWADGQRIYEAVGLGMRIVSGHRSESGGPVESGGPAPRTPQPGVAHRSESGGRGDAPPAASATSAGVDLTLDPARDTWLSDHCPTWTVPALPMMSLVDLLARASTGTGPVIGIRDLRVSGWFLVDRPRRLRSECSGENVRLLDEDGREIAKARVIHGAYRERPAPLPSMEGPPQPLPYATGELFHGPAFQVLEKLARARGASSGVLRAQSGVPVGLLNPALLDGATHGIPHADLHTWGDAYVADKVAYPAFIPLIEFFGPAPTAGSVRVEVRERPFLGTPDYPVFAIQLIGDDGVWCQLELVESCFPKGPIGAAPPARRRAFLRDRQPVEGLRLSRVEGAATLLDDAEVAGSDWLPGTIEAVYGSRQTAEIARREHIAAAHGLHPGRVLAQLPLTRFDLPAFRTGSEVRIEGDGRGRLDLTEVRDFWTRWFGRGPWPVEDLYYGLIERFLGRIVLEAPEDYAALRGRSVLYLANHQTGVESLVFSVVASGLNRVPTVTLAKIEHRETWLGRLIRHCFEYPGVADPKLMTFFDRDDKESLPRIIAELAAEMAGPGRSVMVHVEGTRSLSCRPPVQKMSGAFVDMALAVGAPIVPVRFVGGLPAEPVEKRLEFPHGMGRQDIHLGRPILPEELAALHYGARKQRVIDAINALGVPNEQEQPLPGDPAFAGRVLAWQRKTGVSHEHAALHEMLAELSKPGEPIRKLMGAASAAELVDGSPEGQWLAELGRRLLG